MHASEFFDLIYKSTPEEEYVDPTGHFSIYITKDMVSFIYSMHDGEVRVDFINGFKYFTIIREDMLHVKRIPFDLNRENLIELVHENVKNGIVRLVMTMIRTAEHDEVVVNVDGK